MVRSEGLLIPGGILSGIGLGVYLQQVSFPHLTDTAGGGVFLLAFALGWVLIPALTLLVTGKAHWWPLIPAGIMAVIGGALLAGGAALELLDTVGQFLGYLWPLVLVGIGLYVIAKGRRAQDND